MGEATQATKPVWAYRLSELFKGFSSQTPIQHGGWLRRLGLLFGLAILALYAYALPFARTHWETTICTQYADRYAALTSPAGCSFVMTSVDVLYMAIFAVVAGVMFWRRAEDRAALVGATAMIIFGAVTPIPLEILSHAQPQFRVLIDTITAFGMYIFVLFFFIFPDGRFVPRWLRWVRLLVALSFVMLWLFTVQSEKGFEPFPGLFVILSWSIFGVGTQIWRYQHVSTPEQRQQTKWVIFGGSLGLLLYIIQVVLLLPIAYGALTGEPTFYLELFAWLLRYASLTLIPISIGVSMLHYRLWGIDSVISRTVIYGLSTAVLATVFIASIVAVQRIGFVLTGGENSNVAVAVASLVVAGMFQPTQRRLRNSIERRLYPSYMKRAIALTANSTAEKRDDNPAAPLNPLVGQQIGSYAIKRSIGRGGMADVYLAQHTSLNRPVAIKVLSPISNEPEELRQRFEREANLVAGLRHPNIVQIFDYGKYVDQFYMVMEYVPGPDLMRHLREKKRLSYAQAMPLLQDIAAALDYAHDRNVVHRDIKPSNVLLRPDEEDEGRFHAVLSDFGLAKALGGSDGFTRSGTIGTLDYMAPEQIISARTVDPRADIYAFGVLAYQLVTGDVPFKGENVVAVLKGHLEKPAPDPHLLAPDLPVAASKAILRALAKDPDSRPQRASAFVEQFCDQ
jgi:hypothetical protein